MPDKLKKKLFILCEVPFGENLYNKLSVEKLINLNWEVCVYDISRIVHTNLNPEYDIKIERQSKLQKNLSAIKNTEAFKELEEMVAEFTGA